MLIREWRMALSVTRDARFAGLGGVASLDASRVAVELGLFLNLRVSSHCSSRGACCANLTSGGEEIRADGASMCVRLAGTTQRGA